MVGYVPRARGIVVRNVEGDGYRLVVVDDSGDAERVLVEIDLSGFAANIAALVRRDIVLALVQSEVAETAKAAGAKYADLARPRPRGWAIERDAEGRPLGIAQVGPAL